MQNRSRIIWIAAIVSLAFAAVLLHPATRTRFGWFASGIRPDSVRDQVYALTGPQPEAWVRQIVFPDKELTSRSREVYFDSPTATSAEFSVYAFFLPAGETPLQPHMHAEDELIVPIESQLEVLTTDSRGPLTEHVAPGKVVFNAAEQTHAISSLSDERASYLVLKWKSRDPRPFEAALGSAVFDFHKMHRRQLRGEQRRFRADTIFEGATRNLKKLHSHASTLAPGAGYPEQKDPSDIAVVLLRGRVETLGQEATAPAVFFYPAGRPHGLQNVGAEPAQYVVFEFHGR
jgi:quercetin dioxygenase-like cupin family protein